MIVHNDFTERLIHLCGVYGLRPDFLMAIMAFETGFTFSPSVRNRNSGATGLIQFMPTTAKSLGTTVEDLAQMTDIEQLDYVFKYFRPHKDKLYGLEDYYMTVLFPVAVGKPNDFVLFGKGGFWEQSNPERNTLVYNRNKGLDLNNDGSVTKLEATAKVWAAYSRLFSNDNLS